MEAVKAFNLKFCVDAEYLESNKALGFISEARTYEELTDIKFREFLEDLCEESKKTVTLERLGRTVKLNSRTNMCIENVTACMQDLFTSYNTLFVRNGLA